MRMSASMTQGRRAAVTLGSLVVLTALAGARWVESGQDPAKPRAPGGMANFTGVVGPVDASNVRASRFRYEAGARSYWHSHDGDLVLLIEQGRGRAQVQGQRIQEFGAGQPVFLPAGVPHWHGAAPGEGLVWVSLSIGQNQKWMGPVSDEEYRGTK
jgi:quercetin dioxygenase-like cupin family protein